MEKSGKRMENVSGTVIGFGGVLLRAALGAKRAFQAQAADHFVRPGRLAKRIAALHAATQ
jgi:hypothetical protein